MGEFLQSLPRSRETRVRGRGVLVALIAVGNKASPDMAHPRHEGGRAQAAGNITQRPSRAEQAQRSGRKTFQLATHRQNQAVHATCEHEES
jgi:hypothetical protein